MKTSESEGEAMQKYSKLLSKSVSRDKFMMERVAQLPVSIPAY